MIMGKRKHLNSKRERESESETQSEGESKSRSICYIEGEEDNDDKDSSTPLRPIFCLKNITDLKHFDEVEDCYFLEFDPFHSLNPRRLSFPKSTNDHSDSESELSLVAEKGQLACRDYPHPRYLCLQFPFQTTPHETHCQMCYCYVCDVIAPCHHWTPHCHASHTDPLWKWKRKSNRGTNTTTTTIPPLH